MPSTANRIPGITTALATCGATIQDCNDNADRVFAQDTSERVHRRAPGRSSRRRPGAL